MTELKDWLNSINFNKNDLMRIEELYAIGPAISLLMEGYIESDDLVSLRGTIRYRPCYFFINGRIY